jgi:hypothetical protein
MRATLGSNSGYVRCSPAPFRPLVAKQFREETKRKTGSENLVRDPPRERMNSTAVRMGYLGRGRWVCATS